MAFSRVKSEPVGSLSCSINNVGSHVVLINACAQWALKYSPLSPKRSETASMLIQEKRSCSNEL